MVNMSDDAKVSEVLHKVCGSFRTCKPQKYLNGGASLLSCDGRGLGRALHGRIGRLPVHSQSLQDVVHNLRLSGGCVHGVLTASAPGLAVTRPVV